MLKIDWEDKNLLNTILFLLTNQMPWLLTFALQQVVLSDSHSEHLCLQCQDEIYYLSLLFLKSSVIIFLQAR